MSLSTHWLKKFEEPHEVKIIRATVLNCSVGSTSRDHKEKFFKAHFYHWSKWIGNETRRGHYFDIVIAGVI